MPKPMKRDEETLGVSEARQLFASLVERCEQTGERVSITRRGRRAAVLVSHAEWQELLRTVEALSDPEVMRQLQASASDMRAGRVRPAAEVFDELLRDGA